MVWYIVFFMLNVSFGLAAFVSFVLFILSECDIQELLIITFVALIISIAFGCGATEIENANTTITTDVAQMKITKCEITNANSNDEQYDCYITVNSKHIINVEEKEYAQLNVGDVVTVEIVTKTKFGEVQTSTMILNEKIG